MHTFSCLLNCAILPSIIFEAGDPTIPLIGYCNNCSGNLSFQSSLSPWCRHSLSGVIEEPTLHCSILSTCPNMLPIQDGCIWQWWALPEYPHSRLWLLASVTKDSSWAHQRIFPSYPPCLPSRSKKVASFRRLYLGASIS